MSWLLLFVPVAIGLEHFAPELLMGTAIVPVVNTGDFDKRKLALTAELYSRLSSGNSLMSQGLHRLQAAGVPGGKQPG